MSRLGLKDVRLRRVWYIEHPMGSPRRSASLRRYNALGDLLIVSRIHVPSTDQQPQRRISFNGRRVAMYMSLQ